MLEVNKLYEYNPLVNKFEIFDKAINFTITLR